MSQLLVEYFPLSYDRSVLTEAAGNGAVRIKGTLQRANAKNQNGRIYPKEILMREAENYQGEFIKERRALGELDHPESAVVNLRNVSHNIVEMHWEGDDLVGTIEILSTPSGNIVKELMKNGIRLGVSSRGVGSVSQMGESTVQVENDFKLICFDIVSNPSTQGAFLSEGRQLTESAEPKTAANRIDELIYDFLTEIKA
jgi:hypothetical protein